MCLFSKLETTGKFCFFLSVSLQSHPCSTMNTSIVMRVDYESSKDIETITAAKRMKLR